MPDPQCYRIRALCLVLAGMLFVPAIAAAQPIIVPSPADSNYGVLLIYERIEKALSKDPVDWDKVVREYEIMFAAYPQTEDGKAALLEVARIEAGRGNLDKASEAYKQLALFYPNGTLLKNFWEHGEAIDLKITALMQWAAMLSEQGYNEAALRVLDDLVVRVCNGVVGNPYSPDPWFGPAQVERTLLRAPILVEQGMNQEVVQELLDGMERFGDLPRMRDGRVRPSFQTLLIKLEDLLEAGAEKPPRLFMVLDRAQAAAKTDPARARTSLMRSAVLAAEAERSQHQGRFAEAELAYRRAVLDYGKVLVESDAGELPAGVLAVRGLAELAVMGYQPNQVLMQLEQMASDNKIDNVTSAHALLCYADLLCNVLENPNQANMVFGTIISDYNDVPVYMQGAEGMTMGLLALRRMKKMNKNVPREQTEPGE